MTNCSAINVEILLDADEQSLACGKLAQIADHVESCPSCQSRLIELAASEAQWREVLTHLAPKELDAEADMESLAVGQSWKPPKDWSDAMASALLSPPHHPELLGRLGRYDVERLIGTGGMGVVFKAHDTELNRPVAVKLLAPHLATSGSARSRFAREARAAAAVVDDHVVPIYNVESKSDEVPFLVMQYIAGGTLQQRLDRDGHLAVNETLRIGLQVAKGLAAAHSQGLIHRDVKPSNILLDEGVERALLADFGLARAEDEASLTRSGQQPGTPHYMSPEQVRGDALDGRSDLFSLGCVLYALCTGHPPFRDESSYAVMRRITDDQPRSIREINADVPAWLEGLIFKLLSKAKEDRVASAGELAELLQGCLAHVQHPSTDPLPAAAACLISGRRARPPRKRWIISGAAAFALLLCGVLLVLETDKGTLTIESDVDQVAVRIVQGDHVLKKLVVDREGTKLRLRAGQYALEVDGTNANYDVTADTVTIRRGETQVAKIRYESKEQDFLLTQERSLESAVREFNNLHPADARGRSQAQLTQSEVIAALLWKRDHGALSDDVIRALWLQSNRDELLMPAGWQLTGGLVRQRYDSELIDTWQVNLETNALSDPISIRRTAIGLATPAPKQAAHSGDGDSIELTTAVEQFNVAQEEPDVAEVHYPWLPLSADEVIAAIALLQLDTTDAVTFTEPAASATIKRLQQMVRSGKLPSGASFERVTSRSNRIGEFFTVDSVRLSLPDVSASDALRTLVIRDRFLQHDFKNPAATYWGRPGSNGLQAGVRLVPPQRSYSHGDVVRIEFLFRNVLSEKTAATLPASFQFGKVRGIRLVRADFVQAKWHNGSATTLIGNEPLLVSGHQMQICFEEDEPLRAGVNLQAITRPNAQHYVTIEIPNPGNDAKGQHLETSRGLRFSIAPLTPAEELPVYSGHYYRHWGISVPGHQLPTKSTPDASYVDPFMLGMSLGIAEQSRIPAYFAGGFEALKIAPFSPAEKVGIEVGDIILSWEGHQIYGDDPSEAFLKPDSANRQLKLYQEQFTKRGGASGIGSGRTEFTLLDHRTGEVIDIAPWYGATANGGLTKTQIVEHQLRRKAIRSKD